MATLKELWDAGDGKPVTAVLTNGHKFTIFGIAPSGSAAGYDTDTGYVNWFKGYEDCWTLYQEPKPKKKLYAYIGCIDMRLCFSETNGPDKDFYRVSQFDVEVEE